MKKDQGKTQIVNVLIKLQNKKITRLRAAQLLECSERTLRRYIQRYKQSGEAGLQHKNCGRSPANKSSEVIVNAIMKFYRSKVVYKEFNLKHLYEYYCDQQNDSNLCPTYETFRQILFNNSIRSKHKKRARKEKVHPLRARKSFMGQMVQMDACETDWGFKGKLHLGVDDATGIVVGGYFDAEETTFGYLQLTMQMAAKYGFPDKFYTDNRMTFTNNKHNDNSTQFERIMRREGVEIITTSIPQAKGRIERLNGIFEDRFRSELKFRNITNIDDANVYLQEFIEQYNLSFAKAPEMEENLFLEIPPGYDFNRKFSKIYPRNAINGCEVYFAGSIYRIVSEDKNPEPVEGEGFVMLCLDGSMAFELDSFIYDLEFVKINPNSRSHPAPQSLPWRNFRYGKNAKNYYTERREEFAA